MLYIHHLDQVNQVQHQVNEMRIEDNWIPAWQASEISAPR